MLELEIAIEYGVRQGSRIYNAAQIGPEAGVAIGAVVWFAIVGLVALVSLLLFAFWIWMIVDCATKEPSEGNDKIIWILVIVLAHWLGAIIYYFARRPERIKKYGR